MLRVGFGLPARLHVVALRRVDAELKLRFGVGRRAAPMLLNSLLFSMAVLKFYWSPVRLLCGARTGIVSADRYTFGDRGLQLVH